MTPRLTIGIPTRNRPEMLRRAIDSAFAQTVPVRIVVNDSGECNRSRKTCENLALQSPFVKHEFEYIRRDGGSLWENWKHVARQANGDFFLWLQDDDIISPFLAERVIHAFDRYPKAKVYMSRIPKTFDGRLGCSFSGVWGPKLHLDFLRLRPSEFRGDLLVSIGYFDVWSICPAKAFRVGDPFRLMLDSLPDGCDMYTERLDIAFMGLHGTAIADPNIAGYEFMHDKKESGLTGDSNTRQRVIAFKFLDMLAQSMPDWKAPLFEWFDTPGISDYFQQFFTDVGVNTELSDNIKELRSIFRTALRLKHGMTV